MKHLSWNGVGMIANLKTRTLTILFDAPSRFTTVEIRLDQNEATINFTNKPSITLRTDGDIVPFVDEFLAPIGLGFASFSAYTKAVQQSQEDTQRINVSQLEAA